MGSRPMAHNHPRDNDRHRLIQHQAEMTATKNFAKGNNKTTSVVFFVKPRWKGP